MNEAALNEASENEVDEHHRPSTWALIVALLIGSAIMAFGVRSALGDARDAHPFALAVHVAGFDLVHDAVFAPIILFVGWIVKRAVPLYARGPVRGAMAISLMFTVFSYPLIRRWGQRRGNPSTLPLSYGTNLAIILLVVWAIAAVIIGRRIRSNRASL